MLAVRLTRNADDLKAFFDKVNTVCAQSIWFEHKQDVKVTRTHVHGLIEGLEVSVETLKNWLRFDTLWAPTSTWDKSDWSFKNSYKSPFGKKSVDRNMITYMSKGNLAPHSRKGFDDWTAYRNAWVEPRMRQQTLDEKSSAAPELDKQITQWEMLEQMRILIDQKCQASERFDEDEIIVESIIQVHKIHHKLISRFKVRDYYDTIVAHRSPKSFAQTILILCKKL